MVQNKKIKRNPKQTLDGGRIVENQFCKKCSKLWTDDHVEVQNLENGEIRTIATHPCGEVFTVQGYLKR